MGRGLEDLRREQSRPWHLRGIGRVANRLIAWPASRSVSRPRTVLFKESLTPAFSILHGESVDNVALDEAGLAGLKPGLALAHWANVPEETVSYPCVPELGEHLIASLVADGFDIAAMKTTSSSRKFI